MKIKPRNRDPKVFYTYEEIQKLIDSVSDDSLLESYNKSISKRGESPKKSVKDLLMDVASKAYVSGRQALESELSEFHDDEFSYDDGWA